MLVLYFEHQKYPFHRDCTTTDGGWMCVREEGGLSHVTNFVSQDQHVPLLVELVSVVTTMTGCGAM